MPQAKSGRQEAPRGAAAQKTARTRARVSRGHEPNAREDDGATAGDGSAAPASADPARVLKRVFGYDSFRPNQKSVVDAVLSGRDVLAVMPTGAGKSVCYQVPALCMPGYALVVSPLISLMKDQVESLVAQGVPAACVNSAMPWGQQRQALDACSRGRCKLLYASPERLATDGFASFCAQRPPSMVAVDEAHCISQWGQDFRPSYTHISDFVEGLPSRPAVCAFTATATDEVRADIARSLRLRDPLRVVASFDRPNLYFDVKRFEGRGAQQAKDRALVAVCRKHAGESGIVYCTSRRAVEDVCQMLQDQGFAATRYHAGLSPEERRGNQEDFVRDKARVMVATNAFGMGIDKSDVSFVVHYNMPLDLESYYQEAGRAGRDGEPAECVLLYSKKDVRSCEWLIENGVSETKGVDAPTRGRLVARAKERLRQMTFYATTGDCLRKRILAYFGEDAPGFCGHCGNCDGNFEARDVTVDAQKVVSCVLRLKQRGRRAGRATVVDILRGSKSQKMSEAGYTTLSTYGIMADESTHDVRFVLDALVDRGVLAVDDGRFPVVVDTAETMPFLRERRRVVLKAPKPAPVRADELRIAAGGEGPVGTPSNPVVREAPANPELYQALKQLRAKVAARIGKPAYVVFSNHTLHDMCRRMPKDADELLQVSGVGEVKAEWFGEEFLAVVNDPAYKKD